MINENKLKVSPYAECVPETMGDADALRMEAEGNARLIRDGVLSCIKNAQWSHSQTDGGGLCHYVSEMGAFQSLKQRMPAQHAAEICDAVLGVICDKRTDPTTRMHCCSNLQVLLKKSRELLLDYGYVIQWKPLYDTLVYHHFDRLQPDHARSTGLGMLASQGTSIVQLIRRARLFFPANTSDEVLTLFHDRCAPQDDRSFEAIGLFGLFFPTRGHGAERSATHFDTLYNMLDWQPAARAWRQTIFGLLATLTKSVPSVKEKWTEERLDRLFSQLLVDLSVTRAGARLPSSHSSPLPAHLHFLLGTLVSDGVVGATAKIAAWALGNSPRSGVHPRLERLLTTVDSFFHPSNLGNWSSSLASFLELFVFSLCKRVNRGRFDGIDQQTLLHKKSFDDVAALSAVAKLIAPLASMAMFSRHGKVRDASMSALANIAFLTPDTVLPPILERCTVALNSVTEASMQINSLELLNLATFPMLNAYGANAQLGRLLHLSVAGIDINDAKKTVAALSFCVAVLSSVTLFGSEADTACDMELWAELVVERILELVSHAPSNKKQTSHDDVVINSIVHRLVFLLLERLPESKKQATASRIFDHCTSSSTSHAIMNAHWLISAACHTDSSLVSRALDETCTHLFEIDRATLVSTMQKAEEGAAPALTCSTSDAKNRLLQVGMAVFRNAPALTENLDVVEALLLATLPHKDAAVSKAAARLFSYAMEAFVNTYALDLYELEAASAGEAVRIKTVDVRLKWHVPTEQERDAVVRLYTVVFERVLKPLRTNAAVALRAENRYSLLRAFKVAHSARVASLADPSELAENRATVSDGAYEGAYLRDESSGLVRAVYAPVQVNRNVTERFREIRRRMVREQCDLLLSLLDHLEANDSDDVKALRLLTKTAANLILFPEYSSLDNPSWAYSWCKSNAYDPARPKMQTRLCCALRIANLVEMRCLHNSSLVPAFDAVHERVLATLLRMSLCPYIRVRTLAQSFLGSAQARRAEWAYTRLLPAMVRVLETGGRSDGFEADANSNDAKTEVSDTVRRGRLNGVLHLYYSSSFLSRTMSRVELNRRLLSILCTGVDHENANVQVRVQRLLVFCLTRMFPMRLRVPLPSVSNEKWLARLHVEVKESREQFDQFVTTLVSTLKNDRAHWKARVTAMGLALCLYEDIDTSDEKPNGGAPTVQWLGEISTAMHSLCTQVLPLVLDALVSDVHALQHLAMKLLSVWLRGSVEAPAPCEHLGGQELCDFNCHGWRSSHDPVALPAVSDASLLRHRGVPGVCVAASEVCDALRARIHSDGSFVRRFVSIMLTDHDFNDRDRQPSSTISMLLNRFYALMAGRNLGRVGGGALGHGEESEASKAIMFALCYDLSNVMPVSVIAMGQPGHFGFQLYNARLIQRMLEALIDDDGGLTDSLCSLLRRLVTSTCGGAADDLVSEEAPPVRSDAPAPMEVDDEEEADTAAGGDEKSAPVAR